MAGNGRRKTGMTARDQQIAALVASGLTYTEAGKQLKVSERTIRRAMTRPEMRAEVDAIRGRAVEAGLGLLCEGFAKAVTELERLVRDGEAKDSVKLGAVRLTIEAVLKVRENVTLAREVAELKALLDEPQSGSCSPQEDCQRSQDTTGSAGNAGCTPSGPGSGHESRGNGLGPVAEGVDAGWMEPGAASGFPTSGQE